ncbi:hypothetical protein D3C72_1886380 [compost metagenome]
MAARGLIQAGLELADTSSKLLKSLSQRILAGDSLLIAGVGLLDALDRAAKLLRNLAEAGGQLPHCLAGLRDRSLDGQIVRILQELGMTLFQSGEIGPESAQRR